MTGDRVNERVRKAMWLSGKKDSSFSRHFCGEKMISIPHICLGNYGYDLDVKSGTITYKSVTQLSAYPMDKQTKMLANWLLLQNWAKNNLLVIIFISLAVAGVGVTYVVNGHIVKANTEKTR